MGIDMGKSVIEERGRVLIPKNIREEMKLKPTLRHTGTSGGWPGDITKFLLDTAKMRDIGFTPKHNSEQAVREAARRMLRT